MARGYSGIIAVGLILFLVTGSISQTKYLPKQFISNAQTYAQNNFSPNAALYGITAATGLDTTGKATAWIYWFFKPNSQDSGFAVTVIFIVIPIPTGLGTPNVPGTLLRALGNTFCESSLAIASAENAGGRTFRLAHPNAKLNATIFKIPGSSDTSRPYWTIIYSDSANNSYQTFLAEGVNCSIIPLGINRGTTEIPAEFNLYQNYPNPFNPETKIKFDIARTGIVKITIYDELGRMLETPVDEILNAGSYETIFDASKYSSGVYYYKLEAQGFSITKKMLLIK